MDGRTVNVDGYRFGYQGSEKDNEFKGNGNSYTTEFRHLDPRLGRWLSVDPVIQPWQSSYCSMDNNPIWFNDITGEKIDKDDKLNLKDIKKRLKKDAKKLSKIEYKSAKQFAKDHNGLIGEKINQFGYKRYYVGYVNEDGLNTFMSYGSNNEKWREINLLSQVIDSRLAILNESKSEWGGVIHTIVAFGLILTGEPLVKKESSLAKFIFPRSGVFFGAGQYTSLSSLTVRRITTKLGVRGPAGRVISRTVPVIGEVILSWDIIDFLNSYSSEIKLGFSERQKYIENEQTTIR